MPLTVPPAQQPLHAAQRPEPVSPQEAASLGLDVAGPMPGQPSYTLVSCSDGTDLCVGTVGAGQRASDAARALAVMVYAGELDFEQTHTLGSALSSKGLQMWQATVPGVRAPTWAFAWLPAGAPAAEAGTALRSLHQALDGTVGDRSSRTLREHLLAKVRRAGTCLARGRYVMARDTVVDISVRPGEDVTGDGTEGVTPTAGRASPSDPPVLRRSQDDSDEGNRPPDVASCRAGSAEWLLATAASMGTWDGSDSTVLIRRPRGGGWYGAHIDEDSHPMLRRIPRGTFGYVHMEYICYVTPLVGRRKTFVIYSSAGTRDDRCAPVLEEICRKLPGARVVRRALPKATQPLFTQPDRLPHLIIHKDL